MKMDLIANDQCVIFLCFMGSIGSHGAYFDLSLSNCFKDHHQWNIWIRAKKFTQKTIQTLIGSIGINSHALGEWVHELFQWVFHEEKRIKSMFLIIEIALSCIEIWWFYSVAMKWLSKLFSNSCSSALL